MLLFLNVYLIKNYGLKILIEKKLYWKIWFHPLSGRFFSKNFFRLTVVIKYLDFCRLMLLFFNVCLIQKYVELVSLDTYSKNMAWK